MASSYNRVILMGHLTRDPQPGTLPSGAAVCEFGLAVNRTWADADGNGREDVLFIDCTAFGRPAETLGRYLKKGRPVHVEGRLKLDRWEQDGQARSKVRVVVEQFRFVDSQRSQQPPHPSRRPPATRATTPRSDPTGDRRSPPLTTGVGAGPRGPAPPGSSPDPPTEAPHVPSDFHRPS